MREIERVRDTQLSHSTQLTLNLGFRQRRHMVYLRSQLWTILILSRCRRRRHSDVSPF